MAKAKLKDPSNNFAYLIMICKLYKMKKSKKGNKKNETEIIWSNAEEEVFDEVCLLKRISFFKLSLNWAVITWLLFQEAEYKFEFCVQNEKGSGLAGSWEADDSEMIPYRRVLLFPAQQFDLIVNKVQSLLNTAVH